MKDYSMELNDLVSKIRAISSLCRDAQENQDTTTDLLLGTGLILWDISEDLDRIASELYSE